jgi:long-chain fatty acid transport protein
MKKTILLLIPAVLVLSSLKVAANGLNMNSLGTKAMSMGGAFVGLADDFSAFFWNPAGIAQFKKSHLGISGLESLSSVSYRFDVYSHGKGVVNLVDAKTRGRFYPAWLAAYYHPLNDKWVAGLGISTPVHFESTWRGEDLMALSSHASEENRWTSLVSAIQISPTIAYSFNDRLSLGASLNINYSKFDLAQHSGRYLAPLPDPPYFVDIDLGQYELQTHGWGIGASFGVLFHINKKISAGLTLKTESTAKLKGEAAIPGFTELGAVAEVPLNPSSRTNSKITWPMWIAAGVAIKPISQLTFTADVHWTQWSTIDTIDIHYAADFWQMIMELKYKDKLKMEWNDTYQIRAGAEYKLKKISIRAGFYYSPSPVPENTMDASFPSFDFYALTLGVGYRIKGLCIDLGLEYLIPQTREVFPESILVWPVDRFDYGWQFPLPGTYKR